MTKEKLISPREFTYREKLWLKFKEDETPATLKIHTTPISLINPEAEILDVGCAHGEKIHKYFAYEGKSIFGAIVGVDINEPVINSVNKNIRLEGVSFECMDGTELEFESESFDVVLLIGVLGGVEKEIREGIMGEAFRVLRPGGMLVVAEYKFDPYKPERFKKYKRGEEITGEKQTIIIWENGEENGTPRFVGKHYERNELVNIFSDSGFSSIQIREHTTEAPGAGDGILEEREQFTAWGFKPEKVAD